MRSAQRLPTLVAALLAVEFLDELSAGVPATGADGIRDMGRVMGALKAKYTGQMDFGAVGPQVRDRLV